MIQCSICYCNIISLQLFLGVLPEDSKNWIAETKQMRQYYRDLKERVGF